MVHSLFTSQDDWDGELEGFEAGWPGFFDVLRLYLAHFPGTSVASIPASAAHPNGDPAAWSQLTAALDLAGANVGERRQSPAVGPRLASTVERVKQDDKSREAMLRLDQPAPGIALIGSYVWDQSGQGAVSLFFYGADAQRTADAVRDEWASWLRDLFEAAAA
ncbi:hypothetical protein [Vineibacter terrae]|uniref:hypothetical protein n=1 Tax=Vineibacter terrae TaxID=2586908 RepID=UPI002E37436D|nr:hypothetical protein [Vineibacter terrae]HEX2886555.1 hypothetical protein [Vineibacter terrae]